MMDAGTPYTACRNAIPQRFGFLDEVRPACPRRPNPHIGAQRRYCLPVTTPEPALPLLESSERLSRVYEHARRVLPREPGHDLQHALRVARWSVRLHETAGEHEACVAAALLHDWQCFPKDHPDRARSSEHSARLAQDWLLADGWDAASARCIAEAIRTHSFSRGEPPHTELGRALQDADRLEALGALGVMRTVATGVGMGAGFFDEQDPWARNRPWDDRRYTLDHFFVKLLRLPETFHTIRGKAEAQRRVALMLRFVESLGMELGQPMPLELRAQFPLTERPANDLEPDDGATTRP
mgnify:CR=1 FL=1